MATTAPGDPLSSVRLLYRAVESPDHDDLFVKMQCEPISFQNSNARLLRPQSRKHAAAFQKYVAEETLLGVVICLPPTEPQTRAIPIGTIFLKSVMPEILPHRCAEIGVEIAKDYQGQGYGSEAIHWCLQWAFDTAGLHRVALRTFEWNYGARRLYERLGFKHEGTSREILFKDGKWWDDFQYGMLEQEWRAMQNNRSDT